MMSTIPIYRKVRTLYSCDAENESELSFEPNQIIYNGELLNIPKPEIFILRDGVVVLQYCKKQFL